MSIAGAKWVSRPFQPATGRSDGGRSDGGWWLLCSCAGKYQAPSVEVTQGSTTWYLPAQAQRLAASKFIVRDGESGGDAIRANPYMFNAGDCVQLIDAETDDELLTLQWERQAVVINRQGLPVAHVQRGQDWDTWYAFRGAAGSAVGTDDHLLSIVGAEGDKGSARVLAGSSDELVAECVPSGARDGGMEWEVRVQNGADVALVIAAVMSRDIGISATVQSLSHGVKEVISKQISVCDCPGFLCPTASSRQHISKETRVEQYEPASEVGVDTTDAPLEDDEAQDMMQFDGASVESDNVHAAGRVEAPQRGLSSEETESTEPMMCPLGHVLKPCIVDMDGHTCDECDTEFEKGTKLHQCALCAYDKCERCASGKTGEAYYPIQRPHFAVVEKEEEVHHPVQPPRAYNAVYANGEKLTTVDMRNGVGHTQDCDHSWRNVPAALLGAQMAVCPAQVADVEFQILARHVAIGVLVACSAKRDSPLGAEDLERQLSDVGFSALNLSDMSTDAYLEPGVEVWQLHVEEDLELCFKLSSDLEFNCCFIDLEKASGLGVDEITWEDELAAEGIEVEEDEVLSLKAFSRRSKASSNSSRSVTPKQSPRSEVHVPPLAPSSPHSARASNPGMLRSPRSSLPAAEMNSARSSKESLAELHRPWAMPRMPSIQSDDDSDVFVYVSESDLDAMNGGASGRKMSMERLDLPQRPDFGTRKVLHGDDSDDARSQSSGDSDLQPGGRLMTPRPPEAIVFDSSELQRFRESGSTVDHSEHSSPATPRDSQASPHSDNRSARQHADGSRHSAANDMPQIDEDDE